MLRCRANGALFPCVLGCSFRSHGRTNDIPYSHVFHVYQAARETTTDFSTCQVEYRDARTTYHIFQKIRSMRATYFCRYCCCSLFTCCCVPVNCYCYFLPFIMPRTEVLLQNCGPGFRTIRRRDCPNQPYVEGLLSWAEI